MAYERLDKTYKDGQVWDEKAIARIDDGIESKQDIIKHSFTSLISFENGSVSSTGGESNRVDRCRSDYVSLDGFISASVDSSYKFWVAFYDSDKNFTELDIVTNRSSITIEEIRSNFSSSNAYIRFLVFSSSSLSADVFPGSVKKSFSLHINVLDNTVNLTEHVTSIDNKLKKHDAIIGSKLTEDKTDITFYQGGWNGSTGELNTATTRIHTDLIDAHSVTHVSCNAGYAIWFMTFDETSTKVRLDTGVGYAGYQDLEFLASSNEKYVRFAVIKGSGSVSITPTAVTGFTLTVDNFQANINKAIEEAANTGVLSSSSRIGTLGLPEYMLGTGTFSDATWVGDKYVGFSSTPSDDLETTNVGRIIVYSFDNELSDGPSSNKTFYHKFGHCNTVDYSPVNDCLIMGNGSGDYTLEGKIFIIPNFSELIEQSAGTTFTLDSIGAIIIDCTGLGLGTKFNVMWGEINGTKHNIAYLVTARLGATTSSPDGGDNGTIRRLLLGVGSTALEYGTVNSEATETEFNGTFKILDTYTQEGTMYDQCNQGSCFYRGEIYSAVGHDGIWLWKMKLGNGKITYDEWKQYTYNDDGSIASTNSTSCCIRDGYLYFGAANVGVMAFKL